MPVIALATQKSVYEKTLSNIKEVKARDAVMIGIAAEDDNELEKYVDHVIKVPATDELLIPLFNCSTFTITCLLCSNYSWL